jgi:hypothetical protein
MAVQVVTSTNTVTQEVVADCTPWYLFGGITASNCIIAYTPCGAASYADSLDNNAAPGNGLADGTYDATDEILHIPSWTSADGWDFDATGSEYLTTGGFKPLSSSYTMIIRFSDINNDDGVLAGFVDAAKTSFYIKPKALVGLPAYRAYSNCDVVSKSQDVARGVLAFANRDCYLDGVLDERLGAPGTIGDYTVNIGRESKAPGNYITGKIQAIAIYNTELSAAQIAAVTIAINALPDLADG